MPWASSLTAPFRGKLLVLDSGDGAAHLWDYRELVNTRDMRATLLGPNDKIPESELLHRVTEFWKFNHTGRLVVSGVGLAGLVGSGAYFLAGQDDEKEAADRLKDRSYKVVLIDMKLPQGDGATVFRLVRDCNPQARTILITGHRSEMDQLVQKVVSEGADAVCYKPFDIPRLINTVSKLAAEHKE